MEIGVAPGFRFDPTEEELVSFFLHHRLNGSRPDLNQYWDRLIPLLDVFHYNPWDLPQLAGEVCRGDTVQWFFFNPIQESEINGGKPTRHNPTGYWKSSGSPSYIYSLQNRCIGFKRTLVFYIGRARNGTKTDWIINQYKLVQYDPSPYSSTGSIRKIRQELSLCRLHKTPKRRRSYDRRPVGVYAGESSLANQQLIPIEEDDDNEERAAPQNPLMAITTDPSYAGELVDNGNCLPSQNANADLMGDATADELLWEWELTPTEANDENEERTAPQNPLMAGTTVTTTDQSYAEELLVNNGSLASQNEHAELMGDATTDEPLWDWEDLYNWNGFEY